MPTSVTTHILSPPGYQSHSQIPQLFTQLTPSSAASTLLQLLPDFFPAPNPLQRPAIVQRKRPYHAERPQHPVFDHSHSLNQKSSPLLLSSSSSSPLCPHIIPHHLHFRPCSSSSAASATKVKSASTHDQNTKVSSRRWSSSQADNQHPPLRERA